jgi:hypothetical protein
MLNEAQVRTVALFFSLSLADELSAMQATLSSVNKLNKRVEKDLLEEASLDVLLVETTYSYWQRYHKEQKRKKIPVLTELTIIESGHTNLGPWREFIRNGDPDEYLAILWCEILGMDKKNVAQGLGTTIGTIKHRLSRGLKLLGERII